MSGYLSLEESLDLIDELNRDKCYTIWDDNKELFDDARGSNTKHQAWSGGYRDHVVETMNLARLFYESLSSTGRALPFSLSDSLLVMFLHDIEKPFKQKRKELGLEDKSGVKDDSKIRGFKEELISNYGFVLSGDHINALRYVEDENKDYHPTDRVMFELAAFCHMCDIWSARGWYDYPKKDDAWKK